MKIRYLDLFSGIGGFALGLQIKIYRRHFPNAQELGSVTELDGAKLGRIDLISAGFPCQDISIAGKGAGLEGGRSGLFHQIIRIAKDCRPRIIFLENVSNLLGIGGGRDFGIVLRELAQIGYDAEWNCIPASYIGAPHRRDRIWIVAYPNNTGDRTPGRKDFAIRRPDSGEREHAQFKFSGQSEKRNEAYANGHNKGVEPGTVCKEKEEIRRNTAGSLPTGRSKILANTNSKRMERSEISGKIKRSGQKCDEQFIRRYSGGTNWTVEPNVGRVAHGIPSRVDRLKGLGNAVVPQVVQYVAETIIIPIMESQNRA